MRRRLRHSAILALCATVATLATLSPGRRGCAREIDELLRADANGSGETDISDAVFLLGFLFRGGPSPVCAPVADANADGGTDIGDAIFMLGVFFRGAGSFAPLDDDELRECEDDLVVRCGEVVFETASSLGNAFACAHCHSTDVAWAASTTGLLSVGHGLGDAVARPSYHGGSIATLLEAANRCRSDWMDAPKWGADDREFSQLEAYLSSLWLEPGSAPPLEFDISAPTVSGPSGGDPEAGCELFSRACSGCHGEFGESGSDRAPALWIRPLTPDTIRNYIRLSGPTTSEVPDTLYDGLLGNQMPFWSRQRLSDSAVEDIVAYLEVAASPSRRPCDRVSEVPPEILRGGTFRTFLHGVRGTAEHWSDGRIVLRNFFYDGMGPPDVLVWLYKKDPSDFHAILRGHRISPHMARSQPYAGETLEFAIPEEIADADFNTVSIWCTEFQTNYGEAELRN